MDKKILKKSICLLTVWVFLFSQLAYASLYEKLPGLPSSSKMPIGYQQIEPTLSPSHGEEGDPPQSPGIWDWLLRNVAGVLKTVTKIFSLFTGLTASPQATPTPTPEAPTPVPTPLPLAPTPTPIPATPTPVPEAEIESIIATGDNYMKQGLYKEAIESFEKAIELDPNNAKPYYFMGMVYSKEGKDDEAVATYKKALIIDPNYVDARYRLATIYSNRGNYPEAESQFLKVIELQPQLDRAHLWLGYTYHLQNKYDLAIDQYKKTLAMNPSPELADMALNNLADAYMSKGLLAEAQSTAEEAIRRNPKLGVAYVTLAEIYEKQGKYPEALEALKKLEDPSVELPSPIRQVADKLRDKIEELTKKGR